MFVQMVQIPQRHNTLMRLHLWMGHVNKLNAALTENAYSVYTVLYCTLSPVIQVYRLACPLSAPKCPTYRTDPFLVRGRE